MPAPECQFCGAAIALAAPIPRDAECASCGRDLRCCRNCRHYDPAYNNACRETEAEPVADKERRNFCEFFEPSRARFRSASSARATQARAKLDALFKKPEPDEEA